MAQPQVRFCFVGSTETTGANDEAQKPYNFLRNDLYEYSRWNSSTWHESDANECLQRLADNETDIFSTMLSYPILHDVVKYFTLIKDSRFVIVSSFTPVNQTIAKKESTDSLSAATCFSPLVIVLAAFFIIAFYIAFVLFCAKRKFTIVKIRLFTSSDQEVKLKVWKKVTFSRKPGKIVIGMLVKQSSACARIERNMRASVIVSFRVMLLTFISLLAYLHFSFVTYEKTELGVLDKPFILDSYQAIIDHETTKPLWISYEIGHTYFMKSSAKSMKHHLWQFGRKFCPKSVTDCTAALDAQNAIDYLNRIVKQEITLIASEFSAAIVHAAMCPLATVMDMNPVIMRTDKQEEPFSQALGYHKFMDKSMPDVAKYFTIRGRRTMESGIVLFLMHPQKSPMSSMASANAVQKCLYPHNDDHEAPIILSKSWYDYVKLSLICVIFVAAAIISHLIDLVRHYLSNRNAN